MLNLKQIIQLLSVVTVVSYDIEAIVHPVGMI